MRIASWAILATLSIAYVAGAQSPSVRLPGPGGMAGEPAPLSIANTPDPAINAVVSAVMPRAFARGPVKGLPFSATQTTVHEQTLADGTLIKTTVEVLLWRDAEGRMRAESSPKSSSGDAPKVRLVSVWNPVERTALTWISGNPSVAFATAIHLPESQLNGMVGALASAPPSGALASPRQSLSVALPNPGNTNLHTETLPQDNIAGLDVEGTRTTQVIPAGTVDNDRDITVVSETWTSPELKFTVRQITSDPRSGTVTTELSNIDRSEPDSALFKPPAGSTVMDIPVPPVAGTQR
jgi:hypothetical protein